jgi:hypothetical protein
MLYSLPTLNLLEGDIVSASVLGKTMIILNSFEFADAILNRKGSISAHRPSMPMFGDLVGAKNFTSIGPADEKHRIARIMFQKRIGTTELVEPYSELIQDETRKSFLKVLSSPDRISEHVRQ